MKNVTTKIIEVLGNFDPDERFGVALDPQKYQFYKEEKYWPPHGFSVQDVIQWMTFFALEHPADVESFDIALIDALPHNVAAIPDDLDAIAIYRGNADINWDDFGFSPYRVEAEVEWDSNFQAMAFYHS